MSWGGEGQEGAPGRGLRDRAGGVGSVGQTLACPCLPLLLGGAGLEKAPWAILPQSHNREKEQLHHVPLLFCPGKAASMPPASKPLCSKQQLQLLPFLSLAPIRRRFQPLVPNPALFPSEPPRVPPCQRPVQSHPLSPRYPVAKLPVPGLSHHQQGRATAEGLLS